MGQIESFETALSSGVMAGAADIQRMIEAFETMYSKVYPEGAKFSSAGYSLTTVNLEAIAPKPQPKLRQYALAGETPSAKAYVGTRKVYHQTGWIPFNIYAMVELQPGNVIVGPAIIRDPMTTVVIPPAKEMWIDSYKILHYR